MPEARIIGGPNGAGKSTLAYELEDELGFPYLSADRIAHELKPSDPLSVRVSAGRRFYQRLQEIIDAKENFIMESTLAGQSISRVLHRLRKQEYIIHIAFVFLDSPELCIRRVRERARQGGHDVPKKDIIRRYYRSKNNFWSDYRFEANYWHLLYNASEHFQEVASGEGGVENVTNEELFDLFKRDIDKG